MDGARSFAIPSLAISLTCYPLTCYQTHLLATQLLSHSFAIKHHLLSGLNCYRHTCYQASLAISPICYQQSIAINNFAINHYLLSKFRLALNHYFNQFFFSSKNPQKMKNVIKIWNSSVSGKLCMGIESARFVASSKGTYLLKDGNNYTFIFIIKTGSTIRRPPTGARNFIL